MQVDAPSLIGRVESIWRYPVKSMRGEELQEAFCAYSGVMGDRVWAFVQEEKRPDFPWHSAREQEDLVLYVPRFVRALDPAKPYPDQEDFGVVVRTPDGRELAIDSPELLAEIGQKAGTRIKLRFSEKGMQDARPLSIFSRPTLEALTSETGTNLDIRRFRPNLLVSWNSNEPFYEDQLIGKSLRIGERLEVQIVKKDPRCKIITLDPETAEARPEILRTVAKNHRGCAGVYAAILREGTIRPGDPIQLIG